MEFAIVNKMAAFVQKIILESHASIIKLKSQKFIKKSAWV